MSVVCTRYASWVDLLVQTITVNDVVVPLRDVNALCVLLGGFVRRFILKLFREEKLLIFSHRHLLK